LGAWLYIRRHGLPVLPWLDVLARGFSLAYVFGRAGCSVAHDHPGIPSDFFLAVAYPATARFPAGPRHDLGLYELLLWIAIFAAFHWLGRRPRPSGFYIGWLIVVYAPIRFGLDFLRTNDMTHLGLTFAQWCCLLVIPLGVWTLMKSYRLPPP
jgi:phosphatidylglycerol:prolipoprotein diacylglycerol transferase